MNKRCALLAIAITCAPAIAFGQTGLGYGDRFVATSASMSFYTNLGPRFALLRDRQVVMLAYRRERVFAIGEHAAFAGFMEVPVSLVFPLQGNAKQECWWRAQPDFVYGWSCYEVVRPRNMTAAIGFTPLGFRIYPSRQKRVRGFFEMAAGGVLFDRNTPVAGGSALNFSAECSAGLDFDLASGRVLDVAWKFQHWSNANHSYFNPGLDVNLITVGLKRRR